MTGATCGAGNAQYFRNTYFQSVLGFHDLAYLLNKLITELSI